MLITKMIEKKFSSDSLYKKLFIDKEG